MRGVLGGRPIFPTLGMALPLSKAAIERKY